MPTFTFSNTFLIETRRERLKAQNLQVFIIVKGGPSELFEGPVCCKISKHLKGDSLGTKTFKKSREARKKIQRGTL